MQYVINVSTTFHFFQKQINNLITFFLFFLCKQPKVNQNSKNKQKTTKKFPSCLLIFHHRQPKKNLR